MADFHHPPAHVPELVIFDCDGVLVDSEPIAVEINVQIVERLGLNITRQEAIDRFVGRSPSVIDAAIEDYLGEPLSPDLRCEFDQPYVDALAECLLPGVVAALAQLTLPACVASSDRPYNLERKLTRVGLYERFQGRIFSSLEVANGKAAPDLFLHAARNLAPPRRGAWSSRTAGMASRQRAPRA